MSASLLSLGLIAASTGWTISGEVGAQLDSQPFGVVNVNFVRGPLQLRLITDTVEVRYEPIDRKRRWWVMGRVQAFATQMLFAPWEAGQPDSANALISPHVGAEAGYVFHLPYGFYAGAQGFGRVLFFFDGSGEGSADPPDPAYWLSPEGVVGWWRSPQRYAYLHGGADFYDGSSAAKIAFEGVFVPPGWLAPYVALYAGAAEGQNDVTRTRLGGLNPYVVPLAGAGWAEFRVEDYAVGRFGPQLDWGRGRAALVADLATFDGRREATFAFIGRVDFLRRWYLDVSLGYGPWLERGPNVSRVSAWVLVGFRSYELGVGRG